MMCMQHINLPYLETLVTKALFQPKGTTMEHASPSTCILLKFLSNAEYTNIKNVHIGLMVMCQGFQPSEQ